MSGIDERVVQMKFDNAQFEKGVTQTLGTMDKLNAGLQMKGANSGLNALSNGVQAVSSHFTAMGVAGVAALATIVSKATAAGIGIVKALTIDPIKAGLDSYTQQINATQIILANTKAQGTTLKDVTKTLAQLQQYANLTVFSFSDMTENIGRFTAAGVPLKQATASIKGLANVAALSGASTMQFSSAMYQVSQALSTGVIRLQDWRSVANANMGGTNIQHALEDTAKSMGDVTGKKMTTAIKKFGSFQQSLQSGWLTSSIFNKTMKVMGGTIDKTTGQMRAFSVAELEQMGYTVKQAKNLHQLSQSALDSATQIRTIPQLFQALKEEVAGAWGNVFKTVFGDINQATTLFSALHNTAENALTNPIKNLNTLLIGWAKLGGRTAVLDGLKNIFVALGAVMKPIKEAFSDIFPATTAKHLADMSKSFDEFTKHLKIGGPTAEALKNTFKGLFAILDIGKQVLVGVIKFVVSFFSAAQKGSGGILQLTGGIGSLVAAFDEWLKKGQFIGKFFDILIAAKNTAITPLMTAFSALGKIVGAVFSAFAGAGNISNPFAGLTDGLSGAQGVLKSIGGVAKSAFNEITSGLTLFASLATAAADAVTGLFDFGDKASAAGQSIDAVNASFSVAADTGERVKTSWEKIVDAFKAFGNFFKPIIGAVESIFNGIKSKIHDFIANMGIQDGLAVVNTGFFIAFYKMMRGFVKSLKELTEAGTGTLKSFKGIFDQVTSNLKTMQTSIKADIITKIAISIALLAGAIFILSKVKPAGIAAGLGAMTIILGQLVGGLLVLQKYATPKGAATLTAVSVALVAMSTAMLILAGAVALLGQLDAGTLAKGLGSVVIILAAITGMTAVMGKTGGGATMLLAAAGLLILSIALTTLVGVIELFAALDGKKIANGVLKIALTMAALGLAFQAFPTNTILTAAGLLVVSAALVTIAGVLEVFAHMSIKELAKGLITLSLAMDILAVAMLEMSEGVAGAAAMLIMAGALAIFVPVLATLGSLPIKVIVTGLLALVAVFTVFGVAAAVLAPVVPVMLALGAAIALLGLGAGLAGAGVFLFAAGLTALAAAGAVGAAAALAAIEVILQALPLMAQQVGLAIVAFAKVFGDLAPQLLDSFAKVLNALLDALAKVIPHVAALIIQLLLNVLKILRAYYPALVDSAVQIVISLLKGFTKSIPKMIGAATDLIIAFINAIGKNTAKLAKAGAQAIINFINSMATTIRTMGPQLGQAGANLGLAIIEGMAGAITGGASTVFKAVGGMATGALNKAKSILGIHSPSKEFAKIGKYVVQGFAQGITGNTSQIKAAYSTMSDFLKQAVADSADSVHKLTEKLDKLESARHKDTAAINDTKKALANARKEHTESAKAYDVLTKKYKASTLQLEKLATSYDAIAAKLKTAQQTLADATKTRDDFKASVIDEFDNLPDVISDDASTTPLEDFANSLRTQIAQVQTFTTSLQKLRDLGLNDALYKELLAKGPSAQPFIDQLIAGGADQVKNLDGLSDQLTTAATGLGTTASTDLYQAGVDAAQGIVNGLISQEKAIDAQMTKIANSMVAAIKKALGIKSPSKEMAAIGEFAGAGVVVGLNATSAAVNKSADALGKGAILSLQKSIAGISEFVLTDDLMNPVITPVLDLSQVTSDATTLSSILAATPVAVGASYSQAKDAASGLQANVDAMSEMATPGDVTTLNYTQNNTSPKALSTADVYRQTNNQLSTLKKGLPGAKPS